jgi:hypothetical protein
MATAGWRNALTEEHAQFATSPRYLHAETSELRHASWARTLAKALKEPAGSEEGARSDPKGADWKCEAAARLRERSAAADG